MKHAGKLIIAVIFALTLTSCGEADPEQKPATPADPATSKPAGPNQANKPFAQEQQLIREAGKIQGVLDQDAEEKKKAIEDAN